MYPGIQASLVGDAARNWLTVIGYEVSAAALLDQIMTFQNSLKHMKCEGNLGI
jgi:hypothetical protein